MDFSWELIFAGGPLGIAAIILGLLCSLAVLFGLVHSLVGKSRGWTLGWAATAFAGGLLAGMLAWAQAVQSRALVHLALSEGWSANMTTMALRGHYEVMKAAEIGLWVLILPLGLGAFLLVRGLLLPGADDPKSAPESAPSGLDPAPRGRGMLLVTIGCFASGIGLGLWAIADVSHFGAYVMALMVGL